MASLVYSRSLQSLTSICHHNSRAILLLLELTLSSKRSTLKTRESSYKSGIQQAKSPSDQSQKFSTDLLMQSYLDTQSQIERPLTISKPGYVRCVNNAILTSCYSSSEINRTLNLNVKSLKEWLTHSQKRMESSTVQRHLRNLALM